MSVISIPIEIHPERAFDEKDCTVFEQDGNLMFRCDTDKEEFVKISRNHIGLIRIVLHEDLAATHRLLPLVFEDDHRNACHQRQLSDSGILIWDNNYRDGSDPEAIEFTIIVSEKDPGRPNDYLYLDPIVVND